MNRFNGKFNYRSFCPRAGLGDSRAQITAPWTPPGELTVTTDEAGKVSGTLKFGPLALKISGSVTPAVEKDLPEGIDLTGEGGPGPSVYRVRGYFIAGSNHITGSVLSIQNDAAKQPDGTIGPFILFPA